MQPAPLSPLRIPALLAPRSLLAHDLGYLLRLFVAGWFTVLFLRNRGLSLVPSCAGAAAFALTGYLTLHLPMHHLSVEVWLPAACLATDRAFASGSRASLLGVAAVSFAAGVGGNPQATLFLYGFVALLALGEIRRSGPRALFRVAGAGLFGALAASPALFPALEYIRRSASPHDFAPGLDHFQPRALLGAFVPGLCRATSPAGAVSPFAPFPIGVSVAALALVGFRRRGARLPFGILAAGAALYLLHAFGAPLVSDVLGRLPLLRETRIYKYGACEFAFAAACLAAAGVEGLGRTRSRAAPLALALVVTELVLAVPRTRPERREPYRSAPYIEFLRKQEGPFRTFGILGALPPNVNAVFGIEDVRIHEGILDARFDLYRRLFLDPNGVDPFFDGSDVGERTKLDYEDAVEEARRFLHHGLLEEAAARTPVPLGLAEDERMRFFDLLNVRFLIFGPDQFAAARALAEGTPARYRVVHDPGESREDLMVLESRRAFPRAWLVERAQSAASPERALEALAGGGLDLRREALVEGPSLAGNPAADSGPPVRFVGRGEASSTLEVESPHEAYLVVSESLYPGWRATLDGAPAAILPADGFLRAVRIPAGHHVVSFEFRPRSWNAGIVVGGLALGALLLLLLLAGRRGPGAPGGSRR
ncbi:MAG TPA: hypothetical protein VFI25_14595 [Planctomycetota bacterium]|jgi:hypothetical protein|nr:hypothetical protein [Planctomycetota bacterium]